MSLKIEKQLFIYLSLTFALCTIAGTVSHELGHCSAARLMGFNAHISYGMAWITDEYKAISRKQWFLFTLGGPLQTMLTGTIGLILLLKSPPPAIRPSRKQWVFIFLSLFWLRQPTDLAVWLAEYFVSGKFRAWADEIKLSRYMHLPDAFVITLTALAGLAVLAIVIFKYIPKPLQLTFITSGLVGGSVGYVFWLMYFGKIVMP